MLLLNQTVTFILSIDSSNPLYEADSINLEEEKSNSKNVSPQNKVTDQSIV